MRIPGSFGPCQDSDSRVDRDDCDRLPQLSPYRERQRDANDRAVSQTRQCRPRIAAQPESVSGSCHGCFRLTTTLDLPIETTPATLWDRLAMLSLDARIAAVEEKHQCRSRAPWCL